MYFDQLMILKKLVRDLVGDEDSKVDIVVYKKDKGDQSWSPEWCRQAADIIWDIHLKNMKYYKVLRDIQGCTRDKLLVGMIEDVLDKKNDSEGSQ